MSTGVHPDLLICRCGVHAPRRERSCEHCAADLAVHARSVPPSGLAFAGVRLEVSCPRCPHHWVPVESLRDEVPCTRCGRPIGLDEALWRQVLALAHATADLLGPHPEGRHPSTVAIDRVNPFAELASVESGLTVDPEVDAVRAWLPPTARAWVTSGRPPDPDTLDPLEVTVEGRGILGGPAGQFGVPESARALHSGFVGVVAEEHRLDRPGPALPEDTQSDVVCPSCGEPLHLDGAMPRVRCGHCGVTCHVPAALRHRLMPGQRAGLWWMAFDGPSPLRRALERAPDTPDPPDDRPIEALPVAPRDALDLVATLSLVVAVPTGLLLAGGSVLHHLEVASWLSGWLQGS